MFRTTAFEQKNIYQKILFFVIENNYENPDLQKRIDRKNRRRFFQQQKNRNFEMLGFH